MTDGYIDQSSPDNKIGFGLVIYSLAVKSTK